MLLEKLKYIILALIVLNIPEALLNLVSPALGSIVSYAVFLLLIAYYVQSEKGRPNMWMLYIGLTYYLISSIQTTWPFKEFVIISLKFIIVVICGNEVVKKVTAKDLFIFYILGALSVIIHAVFFPDDYGRYSGLYFNPNTGGFIAIIAFSLTFALKNKPLKTLGTLFSSFGGLLTFSRTFIILWLVTNLISLKISLKNARLLVFGIVSVIFIIIFAETLQVNTIRLKQFEAYINNDTSTANELKTDSRTETWSMYFNDIYENPFYGKGFASFQGRPGSAGVHNSFLLIIGEAGIIPFLLFVSLIIYLLFWSVRLFKLAPHLILITIGLTAVLMADHGFFYYYNFCLLAMWLQHQISTLKSGLLNT